MDGSSGNALQGRSLDGWMVMDGSMDGWMDLGDGWMVMDGWMDGDGWVVMVVVVVVVSG